MIIDTEKTDKLGLTPNDFYLLNLINDGNFGLKTAFLLKPEMGSELTKLGYIITIKDTIQLTAKGKELFPKKEEVIVDTFEEFVEKYRDLFKGLKTGSRGDKNACVVKMKKFVADNSIYTTEVILNATQRYINSCKRDGYKFLQQADYFISKQDNNKIVSSRLLTFCEEVVSLTPVPELKEDTGNTTTI